MLHGICEITASAGVNGASGTQTMQCVATGL